LESWPKNLAADESRRLSWKAESEIGRRRESQADRKARLNGRVAGANWKMAER